MRQRAEVANNELLHIMRPIIIDDSRFNIDLFNSIISSLSYKHDLEEDYLMDLIDLGNEIIRDIMQSPFLTTDIKDKYCTNILKEIEKEEILREKEFNQFSEGIKNSNSKPLESSKFIGMLLGISINQKTNNS
ncbi:hypothetical protein EHQ82_05285 [Leptospira selangorensis]|uniref:Uncharacterized protein n=1 Tax=Leptospira selangorensis TaxID=2484982 RepID=A0ABY2NFW4_9LEPT|nr:hypothetical protein [Leptospira selangorensis]TGM23607.1 hypothetical protein EHQ82_05285 [Leptospira selangorensis]